MIKRHVKRLRYRDGGVSQNSKLCFAMLMFLMNIQIKLCCITWNDPILGGKSLYVCVAVGVLVVQKIGEPSTQVTGSTFHFTGKRD